MHRIWRMYCTARRPPQLEDMYKAAADADEKARLLNALAYAGPGGNIHTTLALALSADVRAQVRTWSLYRHFPK